MVCATISLSGTAELRTYLLDTEYAPGAHKRWPAVIVVPGGAYLVRGMREREPVALQFLARGYHAFVLDYDTYLNERTVTEGVDPAVNPNGRYPIQQLQLMEAIHVIRARADEWGVDAARVFACGFSAGGHIAGSVGVRWNDPAFTSRLPFAPVGDELKPTGCILGYPMVTADLREFFESKRHVEGNIAWKARLIMSALFGTPDPTPEQLAEPTLASYVGPHASPMFIWHTANDPVVNPRDTTAFVAALQAADIPCEYHLFSTGRHGLGCANRYYARTEDDFDDRLANWLPLAQAWMESLRCS